MMENSNTALYVLLIILLGAVLYYSFSSKKEGYADVYYNKELKSGIVARPTFNSNLDSRNLNMRTDPNAYAGHIKGSSPNTNNLASNNNISTKYSSTSSSSSREPFNDFATLGDDTNIKSSSKFKALGIEDTLQYTNPQDLLPTPDMRQVQARDPSDPSNFMYDRTIFAPLKKRNKNEADYIRGDLDIEPIKTGWFDTAQVPHVDLVKGYMGYYNDITEYSDIQDIAYSRDTDSLTKLQASKASSEGAFKPSLKYARPAYRNSNTNNPWLSK